MYYLNIRSLYRHVVCNVPESCKVKGDMNLLGLCLEGNLIAHTDSKIETIHIFYFKILLVRKIFWKDAY